MKKEIIFTGTLMSLVLCLTAQQPFSNLFLENEFTNEPLASRGGDVHVQDSSICFRYEPPDTTTEIPYSKEFNVEFTESGRTLKNFTQEWDDTKKIWVNARRLSFTYNEQEVVIELVYEYWNKSFGVWENYARTNDSLTNNGQSGQSIVQLWDDATNDWVNNFKVSNEFDAKGGITRRLEQDWDKATLEWVNNSQTLNELNPGNQVTLALVQTWNDSAQVWVNSQQIFKNYDPVSELLTEEISNVWDSLALVWIPDKRMLMTYDANGNQILFIKQVWDFEAQDWVNKYKITDDFDDMDRHVANLQQNWADSVWVNVGMSSTEFDENGNPVHDEYYSWFEEAWHKALRCEHFWRLLTLVAVSEVDRQVKCDIPNPYPLGHPFHCDELALGKTNRLEVFDLSGRKFFSKSFQNQEVMRINSPMPTGFYILTIRNEKGVFYHQKLTIFND